METPDWSLIRAFLAVAEHGSLLAAGRALKLSQPALGRQIDELERVTGTRLFVRGRRGMALTEAAEALLPEARAMQDEANRFALKAAGRDRTMAGPVRITASQMVAVHYLPPLLADLRAREPAIEIEIVASNLLTDLRARDADIAVRMVRPTQNDLVALKVNEVALSAWAHAAYLARSGRPASVSELFTHDVIGYDRDETMLKAMTEMGFAADRRMFAFRTDDQITGWELVKAGAGIGFGPDWLARRTAGLERVLPELALPVLPVWLAAHQDVRTNPRIRRTMDHLAERLRAMDFSAVSA